MTINGSKIYGPKGVGVLYSKMGIRLKPIAYGDWLEKNRESLDDYNRRIKKRGAYSDGLRRF